MESEFIMILDVSELRKPVYLEEDIHISSVARIKYTTLLKPHSATICYGKIRQNPDIPVKTDYRFLLYVKASFIENQVYRL